MTVRVRRAFEFEAPAERVWEFISDPGKRAGAISVVRDYDVDGRLPGVERFFKKRLDAELDNLETALRRDLELPA